MKYCSTLTRLRRHYLTDKRDYSVVERFQGMPEMASVWLDAPTQLIFCTGHATFS